MSKNIARSSRWSFSIIIFYIATKRNRTGSKSFWQGGLKLLLNQPALPPPLPPGRPQEQIRKLNGYIRSCWCKNIGIRQLVKKTYTPPPPFPRPPDSQMIEPSLWFAPLKEIALTRSARSTDVCISPVKGKPVKSFHWQDGLLTIIRWQHQ